MLALNVNNTFTFPLYLSMNILLTGQPCSQPEHIDICSVARSKVLLHSSSQTPAVLMCNAESQTEDLAEKGNKSLIQDVSLSSATAKLCQTTGTVVSTSDPCSSKKTLTIVHHSSGTDCPSSNGAGSVELLAPNTSSNQPSENSPETSHTEPAENSPQSSSTTKKSKRVLKYPEDEEVI